MVAMTPDGLIDDDFEEELRGAVRGGRYTFGMVLYSYYSIYICLCFISF